MRTTFSSSFKETMIDTFSSHWETLRLLSLPAAASFDTKNSKNYLEGEWSNHNVNIAPPQRGSSDGHILIQKNQDNVHSALLSQRIMADLISTSQWSYHNVNTAPQQRGSSE